MTEYRHTALPDRELLTNLWKQAFGDERAYIDVFFETAYAPERSLGAWVDDTLAGTLYWFDCILDGERVAYLYAVATDRNFRGQGIASALMERTEAILRDRGYAAAVLSPGSESLFRFYQRLGYVTGGFRKEQPVLAGAPVPVQELDGEEYARVRRGLLPAGGIRQEGENLAFLARFARFYAGEGFCAAVFRGDAFCPEYLGAEKLLPGFLGAVGLEAASVRLPGGEVPVAMIKELKKGALPNPFYLGFPFD